VYICTYVLGLCRIVIGALATAFPFLFLSSRLSLPVHHSIIGLKLLDGMAKSSEYMDEMKEFAHEIGLCGIHIPGSLSTYISDRCQYS
jgi:hypothetical protein